MRAMLAWIILGGCGASPLASSGTTKPAATPMLSELPTDADKRNSILDSAHYQPGPEQHGRLAPKERRAETAAATAAALIGSLFSKTQNVTLGTELVLDPVTPARPHPPGESTETDQGPPPEERVTSDELVPWIRLQPSPPAPPPR
jgi:hypothetical protein